MTPVGAAGAGARDAAQRAGRGHGLADHPRPDRPAGRPAGRRLHHHLLQLALDLPDQRADRRSPASGSPAASCPTSPPAGARPIDVPGFFLSGIAASGVVFGLSVVSLPALPPIVGVVALAVGVVVRPALSPARAAHADPDARPPAVPQPGLPRRRSSAARSSASASAPCPSCCR